MRLIKEIIDYMDDTLSEAENYYHTYMLTRDEYPEIASTSLEMAKIHLNTLYPKWHNRVVDLIEKTKKKKNDIPQSMLENWNYEHRKLVEQYDELKYKIDHTN